MNNPLTTPNGQIIVLEAGQYSAGIATVGAGIQSLRFGERDLVLPFDPDLVPHAYAGKTLAPWPNRIDSGTYSFRGVEYSVPVNEASTATALHGLVVWADWTVAARSANAVVLEHTLHGQPGYPHQLLLRAEFTLNAETGLTLVVEARNAGRTAAPYGVSSHPYLTVDGAPVDDCEVAFTASHVLMTDDRLLPLELKETAGTEFDFAHPRTLGTMSLDHAFTGLPALWHVTLRNPATGAASVLTSAGGTGGSGWLQVYSGEELGRRGMAVEPMTCPPDAFNTGTDLVILEPGDRHSFSYSISAG
ncbi:aldose-1-epimerase [Arthrobacter sp. zg-Y820]|uniref:aldose-1-epimerase n=1 Tax=unclassified Arthrobacter TaxID=235627 RepID=UPI001E5A84A5|nr:MULTISPECIES: aldose-1-epimerase [unclassified Arthrobacter]MCC9196738.1 aldose-1-epimerase [Arthrobacter sp. zg-Y820]MDK1279600.1 aldose-1-epimerase [Arthrobacter sp. zg.Y820]WIB08028.1 aldose-1-epimerase [Arthrobacter sp. zg-Y820]